MEASSEQCQCPVMGMLWKFFHCADHRCFGNGIGSLAVALGLTVQHNERGLSLCVLEFVCVVVVWLSCVSSRHLLCYHNIGPPRFPSTSTDGHTFRLESQRLQEITECPDLICRSLSSCASSWGLKQEDVTACASEVFPGIAQLRGLMLRDDCLGHIRP